MNAFCEHDKDNVHFAYLASIVSCSMQRPSPFNRNSVPSQEALPEMGCIHSGRSPQAGGEDLVDRYFRRAQPDQPVAIVKTREPGTIMKAIGKDHRWRLEMKRVGSSITTPMPRTSVCARLSLFPFLRSRLSQSALLSRPASAGCSGFAWGGSLRANDGNHFQSGLSLRRPWVSRKLKSA